MHGSATRNEKEINLCTPTKYSTTTASHSTKNNNIPNNSNHSPHRHHTSCLSSIFLQPKSLESSLHALDNPPKTGLGPLSIDHGGCENALKHPRKGGSGRCGVADAACSLDLLRFYSLNLIWAPMALKVGFTGICP